MSGVRGAQSSSRRVAEMSGVRRRMSSMRASAWTMCELLLPDTDLSGDIVLLQIEPSGAAKSDLEAGPKETQVVACRVADPSTCIVVSGGREYARAVLPVFEFGRTINVALPRRK